MMKNAKKMVRRVISFIASLVMTMAAAANFSARAVDTECTDEQIAELVNEVAILVNNARKEAGLMPVYVLPYLSEVAEIRAFETSVEFSHTRQNGSGFETTIDREIVPYSMAFENIAGGSDNAEDTFNQWKASKGHWAAIMNEDITHMGIGVYYDPDSDFGWYWQQTFVKTDSEFEDQYLPRHGEEIVPQTIGDINGHGIVNTFDYILLTDYIRKKKTDYPVYLNKAQIEASDCFSDGIISEADAKVLARYILGEYKSLPFVF